MLPDVVAVNGIQVDAVSPPCSCLRFSCVPRPRTLRPSSRRALICEAKVWGELDFAQKDVRVRAHFVAQLCHMPEEACCAVPLTISSGTARGYAT